MYITFILQYNTHYQNTCKHPAPTQTHTTLRTHLLFNRLYVFACKVVFEPTRQILNYLDITQEPQIIYFDPAHTAQTCSLHVPYYILATTNNRTSFQITCSCLTKSLLSYGLIWTGIRLICAFVEFQTKSKSYGGGADRT